MHTSTAAPTLNIKKPLSELQLYFRVLVFGLVCFGLAYAYMSWLKTPNPLNKAVADTAVVLMGLSMLLSSICYFWNFWDSNIVYRKYLGLVGFAFGLIHVGLSFSALQSLFEATTWANQKYGPALTGLLATIIFSIMALISNRWAATWLKGKTWRYILRTGYIAMALVLAHVFLLKSARWLTWWQAGVTTPPALSLLASAFIILVIAMRVVLWAALRANKPVIKR